jgi:hypothetical protein
MPLILTICGVVVLALGVLALRYLWRSRGVQRASQSWRLARGLAIGLSIALPPLSVFATYPYRTSSGTGRVFGFPFPTAYIDSAGIDYVGGATVLLGLGNIVVWSFVPWIALAAYARSGKWRGSGA